MWELKALSDDQITRCLNTISSHTFYMLVGDALDAQKQLSVVRMADGERILMDLCSSSKYTSDELVLPTPQLDAEWLNNYGVTDIPKHLLYKRLRLAAKNCDYFAASLSGIQFSNYNVDDFSYRARYVDNFYPDAWTEEMKINLFKKAQHVLFIHNNVSFADGMQIRAKYSLGVRVSFIKMDHWSQADDVIEKANQIDAPLVLFASGPASKHIGPQIASGGNIPKVTLDLGHTAGYWTLSSLQKDTHEKRFGNKQTN